MSKKRPPGAMKRTSASAKANFRNCEDETDAFTKAELSRRLAELEKANLEIRDSRRAALNLMEDAIRAKEALRDSEELFRQMADNAPGVVWLTEQDGACTYLSRSWYEFTGRTPESGLGIGWLDATHPDDRQYVHDTFMAANEKREAFRLEYRLQRQDGECRWVIDSAAPRLNPSGEFLGYIGSVIDITDRKLAETESARLAAIVESSSEAIISKDLNGIITSWNKGAETLFGYAAEEIIGKPVTILFPEDRLDEESRILTSLRRGERIDHYDTARRRKDGSEIDISLAVSPVRDKTGKVIGASVIARDITERKRAEIEREELLLKESAARAEAEAARAEAENANRTKDEFLAVVSHELRAPLNSILGYNRMLREMQHDAARLKQSCDIIERNARTQLQLIEDLLDTARIASGKLRLELRKLDVMPILAEALDIVRLAAETKGVQLRIADCGLRTADSQSPSGQIKITTSIDVENQSAIRNPQSAIEESAIRNPQPAIVMGDAARLQQIVWNLLSNAIKFTSVGGRVELRAERAGEHIRIVVSDTGKGIHPEFMPYVFDRFRTRDSSSSRRSGGLGLGLTLVKHLAELHGGRVEVASEGVGRGSTFIVTLPLAAESEVNAAEPPALAAAVGANAGTQTNGETVAPAGLTIAGIRVLVVDDQEDARAMLAEFLGYCGAVVTTASSGAEALTIISDPPGGARPDVLLCDIAMPGEDGYTALRGMRALEEARGVAASQRIPAIALTALAGAKERLRALSAGFRFHIAKPVDPVELMYVIANTVGTWRQEEALY